MKERLTNLILDFLTVVTDCLYSTSFAEDRNLYRNDLALAATWLARLHKGDSDVNVAEEIISTSMNKHYFDYWRQGEWGEKEAGAFAALVAAIEHLKAEHKQVE